MKPLNEKCGIILDYLYKLIKRYFFNIGIKNLIKNLSFKILCGNLKLY